jgi:hypothetical protein
MRASVPANLEKQTNFQKKYTEEKNFPGCEIDLKYGQVGRKIIVFHQNIPLN